jgi:hypothetical protein
MLLDKFTWDEKDIRQMSYNIKLLEEHNIMADLYNFKKQLVEGDTTNADKYAEFLRLCVVKYNEEVTKYYFNYIMLRILSYD